MGERYVATYEIEFEFGVLNEEQLLNAAFPRSPLLDPSQHLGLAITELMRSGLVATAGLRMLRARGRDEPVERA